MSQDESPAPLDGIYRAILIVLVGSVIFGALATIAGDLVFQNPGLSQAGAWLALICGVLYFFFRWLGRREMARRRQELKTKDIWDDFDERDE